MSLCHISLTETQSCCHIVQHISYRSIMRSSFVFSHIRFLK
jgi:hypothetical protein